MQYAGIDAAGQLWAIGRSHTAACTNAYTATRLADQRQARATLRFVPAGDCVYRGATRPLHTDPLLQEGWSVGRTQWRDIAGVVHATDCDCLGVPCPA